MRTLIQASFMVLSSVTSVATAQSLHPPVTTFPINDATVQPVRTASTPAPATVVAPVVTPASVPPAATRPVVAAVPAPATVAATPAVATASAPASRPVVREQIGDVTQQLLAAQAQGVRAGIEQPMLGATATASWERYINSFKHPIPEWFEKTVDTD